jgi:hypothetical protein
MERDAGQVEVPKSGRGKTRMIAPPHRREHRWTGLVNRTLAQAKDSV